MNCPHCASTTKEQKLRRHRLVTKRSIAQPVCVRSMNAQALSSVILPKCF